MRGTFGYRCPGGPHRRTCGPQKTIQLRVVVWLNPGTHAKLEGPWVGNLALHVAVYKMVLGNEGRWWLPVVCPELDAGQRQSSILKTRQIPRGSEVLVKMDDSETRKLMRARCSWCGDMCDPDQRDISGSG